MSPATLAGAPVPASALPEPYRFTVDQYERMAEVGILTGADRVELINGIVVIKMAKGPAHVWATKQAGDRLGPLLGDAFSLRREAPARIPELNEPEPDLVIAWGDDLAYLRRHPEPADIALIIGVSDTTYRYDRDQKYAVFAKAGIPAYWIINLVDRRVEVYTRPVKAGRYRSHKDFRPGQQVPVVIDGQQLGQIAVDDILPPEPAAATAEGHGA
jgi:Uma2 family endonuclease